MGGSTSGRRCGPARQRLDSLPGSGALFERGTRRPGRLGRLGASIRLALDGLALGWGRGFAGRVGGGAALACRNIRMALGGFAVGTLVAVAPKRRRLCGFAGLRLGVGGTALAGRRFGSGLFRTGLFRSGLFWTGLGGLAVGALGAVAQKRRLGAGSWTGGSDDRPICVERSLARRGVENVVGRQQPDHDRTGDAQEKRMQRIITHFGGVFA